MATNIHGKYGQVDFGATTYSEATAWDMTINADTDQYSVFGGDGWKKAVVGDNAASGSVQMKQDFDVPIDGVLMPGDEITLKLYEATASSPTTTDDYWTVPAVITELSPSVGAEDGAVSVTVSWISRGVVTRPARA